MKWFLLALAVLTFQAAAISVSPQSGRAGDTFKVAGRGFVPSDRVRILWDGSNMGKPAKVGADGSFTYSGRVPAGASVGDHSLEAQGRSSGSIRATYTVESAPTTTATTTTNSTTGAPTTTIAKSSSASPSPPETEAPPTTPTTTSGAVMPKPDLSTTPTQARTTPTIKEPDTEPRNGAGGFLGLLVALAVVVGGITLWVWHRREAEDLEEPSTETSPPNRAAASPPPPSPPVDAEAGGWTRRAMQLRPAGEVNAVTGFLGGLLGFGAETRAEDTDPPRAVVWRSNGTDWIGQAGLDTQTAELGVGWRDGLLLLGSEHRPDGYAACTWWSADGKQWDRLTSPGDPTLERVMFDGIAVGDTTLVTYGRAQGQSGIWTSHDGTTWRQSPLRGVIDLVSAVPGGFVTFGHQPDKRRPIVARSQDGISWDTLPAEALIAFEGVSIASLVVFDGGLVAAGIDRIRGSATVWVSDNGSHWLRAPFEPKPGTSIEHLLVVNGRLVAVGSDRGPQRTGRAGTVAIWESPDAITWERLKSEDLLDNAVARSVTLAGESLIIFGTLVAGYESPWPEHTPVIWTREESIVGAGPEPAVANT